MQRLQSGYVKQARLKYPLVLETEQALADAFVKMEAGAAGPASAPASGSKEIPAREVVAAAPALSPVKTAPALSLGFAVDNTKKKNGLPNHAAMTLVKNQ